MAAFRSLQQSVLLEVQSQIFKPFIDERDSVGNIKGVERKVISRGSKLDELRKAESTKPSRRRKTVFLKEIYQSNQQSSWNELTKVKTVNNSFRLSIETEEFQKPMILFNKKLQFNEIHKQNMRSRRCSGTASPKLGRVKKEDNVPPLGYYDVQEYKKKQPMFVCMEQSKSPREKSLKTMTSLYQRINSPCKDSQRQSICIGEQLFERAYATERLITEQKFQYMPKLVDIGSLEVSNNKMKELRLRFKQRK
ncbi:hypothetical protein pb186bvf_013489 [Paramecium bursaria]